MTSPTPGGVPTWLTAVITAAGVVLGAVASATAVVVAANRKVRELEVTYRQKLQDNYLENARAYTNSVYVPLATSVTKLAAEYERLRTKAPEDDDAVVRTAEFDAAVTSFIAAIEGLQDRGAAAFLTVSIEEELGRFVAFLKNSQGASETTWRAIITASIMGLAVTREVNSALIIRQAAMLKALRYLPIPWPLTPQIDVVENRVGAAPVFSKDFEAEFAVYISRLRLLVKEVTLGAHARQ
ncbi:hypothetical protein [Dactylosporangium sp. NPDC051541]|uniref:hypothetical protein n=1 Tax=Dactylosporangium sp. NPDC051541 TaxID=3363977 RepID=UPI00379F3169